MRFIQIFPAKISENSVATSKDRDNFEATFFRLKHPFHKSTKESSTFPIMDEFLNIQRFHEVSGLPLSDEISELLTGPRSFSPDSQALSAPSEEEDKQPFNEKDEKEIGSNLIQETEKDQEESNSEDEESSDEYADEDSDDDESLRDNQPSEPSSSALRRRQEFEANESIRAFLNEKYPGYVSHNIGLRFSGRNVTNERFTPCIGIALVLVNLQSLHV